MIFLLSNIQLLSTGAWFIFAVVCFIIESRTVQLVSIWFAISALVACILAAFNVPFLIQAIVFVVLAVILLILSRFIFKKLKNKDDAAHLPQDITEDVAIVTKEIQIGKLGEVKTRYDYFTAKAYNPEQEFAVGEEVIVKEVSGNKVLVEKK